MAGTNGSKYEFLTRGMWDTEPENLPAHWSLLVRAVRYVHAFARLFDEGQLSLRAMGLVYTTLLSLVPLIAVSFSVLKAFGVHNQVRPLLQRFLAPLGPKGDEITMRVIEFVGNMKVGVLGSLGLALLIYTVISLISKVESSFNHIWRVTNPRSMTRRFTDYMSLLLIGPLLIFSAFGITAAFMSSSFMEKVSGIGAIGYILYLSHDLVPYVITCAAFTFVYMLMPSTKVKFRPALVGGALAGIIWEFTGWGFARFVVSSSNYSAIYSGFAIIIMFMLWVYISWLILLVGASISFYHQFPQYLTLSDEDRSLSNRHRERLGFAVMYLAGERFHTGGRGWSMDALVERLAVPVEPLRATVDALVKNGLLVATGDEPPAYLPARDMETIQLQEILDSVRTLGEHPQSVGKKQGSLPEVDAIAEEMDAALGRTLTGRTLHDLVAPQARKL